MDKPQQSGSGGAKMSKIVSFTHVSLDGFACGLNGELAWAQIGEEIQNDVSAFLATAGAAIYGRVTYGMMHGYWPTVLGNPSVSARDVEHARWVEAIPKIVISRSLEGADWNNTTVIRDNVVERLDEFKRSQDGDLVIFGSPKTTHLLANLGVVDEYLIYLNPVTIGAGVPLFEAEANSKLALLKEKRFEAGVVALRYALEH
jgi:dihydrofolate reductase